MIERNVYGYKTYFLIIIKHFFITQIFNRRGAS